ncbi:unnamed protein product, partial [Prorocentrum cordatum]
SGSSPAHDVPPAHTEAAPTRRLFQAMAPVALAVVATLLGLSSGGRVDRGRRHEAGHHARGDNATAAELEHQRTKDLLERASAEAASAQAILKEVQDAGIYKAAENLRRARAQEDAKEQQKLLGTMDLMLRSPAPAKDRKQAAKQPVQTQVSQKDMDAFVATLSSACGKQFNAIMAGSAPAIHTFGEVGVNSTEGGCGRLEGALCDTEAQIESAKSGPADRRMRSLHHVTGQGCLPSQCTQKDDLAALAGFMQSRAKEAVPGTGILVRLSVDCTGSGGATAKVGYDDGAGPTNQLHKALSTKSGAARGGAALAALAIGAAAAM